MARRITIDRAVEILREEYEKACKNPVVRNPVAYALYQTWKRCDNQPVTLRTAPTDEEGYT